MRSRDNGANVDAVDDRATRRAVAGQEVGGGHVADGQTSDGTRPKRAYQRG